MESKLQNLQAQEAIPVSWPSAVQLLKLALLNGEGRSLARLFELRWPMESPRWGDNVWHNVRQIEDFFEGLK